MELKELNKSIKARMEEVSKMIKDEGQKALKAAFDEVFKKYPELHGVVWTQYTPYFNDGEECEFRVRELCPIVCPKDLGIENEHYYEGDESFECESDGKEFCTISIMYDHQEKYKDNKYHDIDSDVGEIGSVDDQVMQAVFGNHVKVVATREGFDVEDYDHD